ncbi:DUF1127 domain-containing protein [Aureimonas leprariae]|uniref:DUF1127 domain-containing protein n=1 Tax=Plantimonas leprariae TaxID=2615207 RepID=A0A7V7PK61_9HYPH|nr:DUF1127 domain-containing protein [Aureimonas leprariae]KAB0675665.1 DUF1127 domain-containing protein [Aureimonas leprariae]
MNIARTIRTWRRVRETRAGLNRFPNHLLADLGITRADIPAVARRLVR